jgi:Tfp pilus assembly protein PilZ
LTFVAIPGYDARMGPKAAKGELGNVGVADGADGAERRRAPRVLVDLEVDYASEENYLFAYITDISATGIFVRTTTPEQPGTHLNLRFQLPPPESANEAPTKASKSPRGTKIEVEGEVIWVNPYRPGAPDNLHPGMGIRFVGLDDEVRDQLLELIRRFAYLS